SAACCPVAGAGRPAASPEIAGSILNRISRLVVPLVGGFAAGPVATPAPATPLGLPIRGQARVGESAVVPVGAGLGAAGGTEGDGSAGAVECAAVALDCVAGAASVPVEPRLQALAGVQDAAAEAATVGVAAEAVAAGAAADGAPSPTVGCADGAQAVT